MGVILTKNKQQIPSFEIPAFIIFNDLTNFLSIKFLNKYLDSKKQTKAPREEANDAKIIPCTNPNKAPIIKHNIAAIGKANTAAKKYIMKKKR